MAPFVPDLISDQLNLIIALLLGIGFGIVLEQAGFSSSRRLAGVFFGYDFTVLRVFFTAGVTAISGLIIFDWFGLIDLNLIYVNEFWVAPAIVGGVIMGAGFILGGYCPGTSICAAAIGKIDAMFFIIGGIIGVFGFGELLPAFEAFYTSTFAGDPTVMSSLGLSRGLFALLLIIVAIGAFVVTTILEKRISKNAPSLLFPKRYHLIAGLATALLGFIIFLVPDREQRLIVRVNQDDFRANQVIELTEPDELAFRILDKDPALKVIDLRTGAERTDFPIPTATPVKIEDFFSKAIRPVLTTRGVEKVIVATSEDSARTAALLLKELGFEEISILKGGATAFRAVIFDNPLAGITEDRYASDVARFRSTAGPKLTQMAKDEQNKPETTVAPKKVKGGC